MPVISLEEFVFAICLGALAVSIGGGMFLYLPFASRRTLPPIFYCTEAFAFVGAGAGVIGVVFFYTLFSMPLPWLTGNLPRLWPLLPTDAAGILIGFLIASCKLAKAK